MTESAKMEGCTVSLPDHTRSISNVQVRRVLTEILGAEIAPLRRLNAGQRCREFIIFGLFWLSGALLIGYGLTLPGGLVAYSLRIAGTILAAIALNAMVLLQHEGMHHTLFRNRHWNYWCSVVCGGTVLIAFSAYRLLHLRHHRYLGDPRDLDEYRNHSSDRRMIWAMHYMRLCFGSIIYIVLIPFIAYQYGIALERRRIRREYTLLALAYTLLLLFVPHDLLLHTWFIPLILAGFLTNIRGLNEHGFTETHNACVASRTMVVHPIVAFCMLNINYHLEHHLFPEVPSYHLPQIHALIWPHLPQVITGTSYIGFLGQFFRATLTLDDAPIGLNTPIPSGEVE